MQQEIAFSGSIYAHLIFSKANIQLCLDTRTALTPYSPHPVRITAQGRPVFVLRIMPWADDVSGNRSKQYNAHMNMYLPNINIPHKLLAQEYFVQFCATSPHASSLEQFDALSMDWYDVFGI